MLGNLHLLAHLILEVNAYSIIPLFSPSEKKIILAGMELKNPLFFFSNEKTRQKYCSVQGHKHCVIPQPQWLPTALRIKPKILQSATIPPQFSQPSRLLPTRRPLCSVPRSVNSLPLPSSPDWDASVRFPLGWHLPGNVCLPSWGCHCTPRSEHQWRTERSVVA